MITIMEAAERFLTTRSFCKTYEKKLQSLIIYGKRTNKSLTWDNLMEWIQVGANPQTKKTKDIRKGDITFARALIRFTNSEGLTNIIPPYTFRKKPNYVSSTELNLSKSVASDLLEQYFAYKRSANAFNKGSLLCLRYFNEYCAQNFPYDVVLSDKIVKGWCQKRETEQPISFNVRIGYIRSFLSYTNKAGLTDLKLPECLPREKKKFVPHPFTDDELTRFFNLVDNQECIDKHQFDFAFKLRKIVLPVFFRLLYSSGIRTCEARRLRCCDVDLENGIINIVKSKSIHEHRVAMHKSMWELMIQYDLAILELLPNRKAFFPNEFGESYSADWESYHFNRFWKKVSNSQARCYDFRSNYAVTNINSWKYTGPEWSDKFLYLSRSMGHAYPISTAYYYHLVPLFAEQLKELTEQSLNEILPNLTDYYNDEE